MSRIGRLPVSLPSGAKARVTDAILLVEGPKGKLQQAIPEGIKVVVGDTEITVERETDQKHHRALHGLIRSLTQNMVTGVIDGFSKILWVCGVGYTAKKQGQKLVLQVGLGHSVEFNIPAGLDVADPTVGSLVSGSTSMPMAVVTISGADKQAVGQLAAAIRACRKPDPYQGKGVRYSDEQVRRKAGKRFGAGA